MAIDIKPENKGKFTEWAKSHGMGVQEAASHVLANKENYSATIVKRANFAHNAADWIHAKGGYLYADGGNMQQEQLTQFDAGGTHEQNPLGGIPQGTSSNGQPNLVEQGETKLNASDYVFSDRLILDKPTVQQFNLPNNYVGKTFAEASRKVNLPNSRRENDSIEEEFKAKNLENLMNAQEDFKQKDLESDMNAMMEKHPELANQMQQSYQPQEIPQQQEQQPNQEPNTENFDPSNVSPQMAYGGTMYDFGGIMRGIGTGLSTAAPYLSKIPGLGTIAGTVAGGLGAGLQNVGTGADLKEIAKDSAFGLAKGAAGTIPGGSALVNGIENNVDKNTLDASELLKQDELTRGANTFPDGGKLNTIYTSNINDPRLKAYNDSLSSYNSTKSFLNNIKNDNIIKKPSEFPYKTHTYSEHLKNSSLKPYKAIGYDFTAEYPLYKKPIQKVVYSPEKIDKKTNINTSKESITNNQQETIQSILTPNENISNIEPQANNNQNIQTTPTAYRSQTVNTQDPKTKEWIKSVQSVPYYQGNGTSQEFANGQGILAPPMIWIDADGITHNQQPAQFAEGGNLGNLYPDGGPLTKGETRPLYTGFDSKEEWITDPEAINKFTKEKGLPPMSGVKLWIDPSGNGGYTFVSDADIPRTKTIPPSTKSDVKVPYIKPIPKEPTGIVYKPQTFYQQDEKGNWGENQVRSAAYAKRNEKGLYENLNTPGIVWLNNQGQQLTTDPRQPAQFAEGGNLGNPPYINPSTWNYIQQQQKLNQVPNLNTNVSGLPDYANSQNIIPQNNNNNFVSEGHNTEEDGAKMLENDYPQNNPIEEEKYTSRLENANESLGNNNQDLRVQQSLPGALTELAPVAYNLGMGLFGKINKLNPNDYLSGTKVEAPKLDITPQIREGEQSYATAQNSIANSGTSGGAYMTNLQQLANDRNKNLGSLMTNKENIDAQNKLQADEFNAQMQSNNNSTKFSIQDYNARARAAKQGLLGQGLGQVADIAKNKTANKLATSYYSLNAPDFKNQVGYTSYWDYLKNKKNPNSNNQ